MKRTNTAKWIESRNRWQINVQKDGERKAFTSSTPRRNGQREANAKADSWLDDGISSQSTKVATLCDEYIIDLKERTSISNWRPEESRINNWIKPQIGNIKISD